MTMLVSDPYFAGPRLPVAAFKSYVAANGGLGQYSQFIDEVVRVCPLMPISIDDAIVCAQADYECGTWSSGYWTANGNAGGIGIYASGVASPFSVPNNGALSARIFIANIWLLLGEGPNLPPILSDVLNVAGLGPYLSRVNAAAKDPNRPLVRRIQDLNIAYTSSSGSSECTYACDPTYGQGIVARFNGAVTSPNTRPPGVGGGTTPTPSPAAPDIGAQVAALAEKQLGKQYVWATHGPNTFDCCLTGDTLIPGPDGVRRIDEIEPGHRVWSFADGRFQPQPVTAAWQSKRQPVYRLRTQGRSITASANHPFLAVERTGGKLPIEGRGQRRNEHAFVWRRLDELQRGDRIVVMRRADNDNPPMGDLDFAWLLGLIVGDGHVSTSRQPSLSICVYGKTRERAAAIIRRLGGGNPTFGEGYGLRVSAATLSRALLEMGVGRPSYEKRVPPCVWGWDEAAQRAFLDGYCAADGHRPANAKRHGERTYASASADLIREARMLHLLLGDAVSNITTHRRTKPIAIRGVPVKHARPLHAFTVWAGGHATGAKLRTGWTQVAEMAAAAGDTWTIRPVLGIEPAGEEDTYDLEVAGAGNFVADGIVVHNSGLVCWCYAQITGKWITCGSSEQWHSVGWGVPISALHKGDILCFDTEGTGDAGHVGIYDGKTSNGRHTMVNAENPSVGVVRADPFDAYFSPIYLGAKRLYNPPVPAPTTPLPIPPPNPVPTPPGTPQPPTVVSRALAQWSVLQLFFTQTNVGTPYTMPQEEVYKALAVGGNFPGKVKALSGGRCAIDHHWAIVNTPITTATVLPDGTHYPNSTDIAATLAAYNWAAYDAVVVFFPNEGIPCGYDGTTATGTTGSYTTIRVNNATWDPKFELEMVVLQWMQEVSSTMTAKGFAHAPFMLSPNLYKSIGGLSYSDPATGRNNFLQDSMTNRLQELTGGSTAGISDAAWKAGPPVTPALTDPSRPITFPFDPVTYPAAVDWTTLQVGDVLLAANDNSTTFQATSGGAVLGDLPAGTLCIVKSLPQVTVGGVVLTNVTTRYGDGWAPLGYADITTGYVDRCRNGSLDDDTTAVFPNTPSSQLSRVFLGETFVAKCECWGQVPYEGLRFDSARGMHLPAPRTIVAVAEVCGQGTLDFATCRLWSNRGPSVRGVPAAGYEDQRGSPLVLSSSQWQRLVIPAVEQDPNSPLEKVEGFYVFSSPMMTTVYLNNVHFVEV